MKKSFLKGASAALVIFLAAVSCGRKTDDFSVDLDVKGITSTHASVTVFGLRDSVRIPSDNPRYISLPVEDGKIAVHGTAPQSAVLRLTFSDDKQFFKNTGRGYFPNKASSLWFVVGPGTRLKLSGDLTGKDFVDMYPYGDYENKMFARLSSVLFPVQSRMGDIAVALTVDSTLTDVSKEALRKESEALEARSDSIRRDFVGRNPSCIAALWLMEDMLVRSQMEPAELEPLLAKVAPKYHDNYFYYTVAGRIEGAKSASVGAPCPRLAGEDMDGNPFDIKDCRGKYVIIDFWGTWCGACLHGMPAMKAFRDKHADKLMIVGVANDKDKEQVRTCMEKMGMDWTNLMQGKGDDDFVAKFNVQGFPTKVLLDPRGTIVYRGSGEREEFYTEVEKILEGKK